MKEQLPRLAAVIDFDFCPLPKILVPICILLVLFLGPFPSQTDVTYGNSQKCPHIAHLTLNHKTSPE